MDPGLVLTDWPGYDLDTLIAELESITFESETETESGYNSAPGSLEPSGYKCKQLDTPSGYGTSLESASICGSQREVTHRVEDAGKMEDGVTRPDEDQQKVSTKENGQDECRPSLVDGPVKDRLLDKKDQQTPGYGDSTTRRNKRRAYGSLSGTRSAPTETTRGHWIVERVTTSKDSPNQRKNGYADVTQRLRMAVKNREMLTNCRGWTTSTESSNGHLTSAQTDDSRSSRRNELGRYGNRSVECLSKRGRIDPINTLTPGQLCGGHQTTDASRSFRWHGSAMTGPATSGRRRRRWTDTLIKCDSSPEISRDNPFRDRQLVGDGRREESVVAVVEQSLNLSTTKKVGTVEKTGRLLPVKAAIVNNSLADDSSDDIEVESGEIPYMEKHSDGGVGLYPTVIRKVEGKPSSRGSGQSAMKRGVPASGRDADEGTSETVGGRVDRLRRTAGDRSDPPPGVSTGNNDRPRGDAMNKESSLAGDKIALTSSSNGSDRSVVNDETTMNGESSWLENDNQDCPGNNGNWTCDASAPTGPRVHRSSADCCSGSGFVRPHDRVKLRNAYSNLCPDSSVVSSEAKPSLDNLDEIVANCRNFKMPFDLCGSNDYEKSDCGHLTETDYNSVCGGNDTRHTQNGGVWVRDTFTDGRPVSRCAKVTFEERCKAESEIGFRNQSEKMGNSQCESSQCHIPVVVGNHLVTSQRNTSSDGGDDDDDDGTKTRQANGTSLLPSSSLSSSSSSSTSSSKKRQSSHLSDYGVISSSSVDAITGDDDDDEAPSGNVQSKLAKRMPSNDSLYDNPQTDTACDVADDEHSHKEDGTRAGRDTADRDSRLKQQRSIPKLERDTVHSSSSTGEQKLSELASLLSPDRRPSDNLSRPASICWVDPASRNNHRYVNRCYSGTPSGSYKGGSASKKSSLSSSSSHGRGATVPMTPGVRDGWTDRYHDTSSSYLIGAGKKKKKWSPWRRLCCLIPQTSELDQV
ncbi:hypothetical protein LSH36_416g01005 [Paralvinella palmiformis]|uniref:Uncharacterized protein n=1 Tax=Paralvinella palmiformis TaxID=53620 RepID=A0AAD9JCB4_9ANNE|nr:hypothetical protein LSH36_416g01005 [Paralvinella palmiformis]